MLTVAVGSLALGLQAPPKFSKDFYVGRQMNAVTDSGGYDDPDGDLCCTAGTEAVCQVKIQASGQDVRQQGSMNRTRHDTAGGAIVNWCGAPQIPTTRPIH